MLPLGIAYFVITVTSLAVSLSFIIAPVAALFLDARYVRLDGISWILPPALALPLMFILGVLWLFAYLHLARGVGRMHGHIAKHFLVKSAQY